MRAFVNLSEVFMGQTRLETQVVSPVKSASVLDDAVSRERAYVTLTLDPHPNQRQVKSQREWSTRALEKRFLWKELFLISPFGGKGRCAGGRCRD